MKLTFRQGIARHQTDVNGNPTFLQRSGASSQFIDLIVSPQPTILAFAHRAATYVIEELKTVSQAWGPIPSNTVYLYWDVNLLSGVLTRGLTQLPPLYSSAPPPTPQPDQHWFDTVNTTFFVWNGSKWVEKVRVFAGWITSGSIVHAHPVGSQAGLNGDIEGGNIVLDSFSMPLRESNGCFVTTVSWLNVVNLGTVTARLDAAIMSGMAAEEIPKFSLVQLKAGRRMVLARSTDHNTRIAGIVSEDLYEGEVARLISVGLVRNESWNWSDTVINRPLFCGPTGQITTTPPKQGVVQQVGFVYDTQSVFIDIKPVIVLDDPNSQIILPTPVPTYAPIANFTMSATSGTAPFAVTFTNTSTDYSTLEWDFTNDGYVDSTSTNPSYTYEAPGTYTVRLRATNSSGFDDEIKSNVIVVAAPARSPDVNLGISFGAPSTITGGSAFTFQVIVTNNGQSTASNVSRKLVLRTSNGSAVAVLTNGITTQQSGPLTKITLPNVDIAGGAYAIFNIQAQAAANAGGIQLEGSVSCDQHEADNSDNSSSLTIGVRP